MMNLRAQVSVGKDKYGKRGIGKRDVENQSRLHINLMTCEEKKKQLWDARW